jgi:hypothetical protein
MGGISDNLNTIQKDSQTSTTRIDVLRVALDHVVHHLSTCLYACKAIVTAWACKTTAGCDPWPHQCKDSAATYCLWSCSYKTAHEDIGLTNIGYRQSAIPIFPCKVSRTCSRFPPLERESQLLLVVRASFPLVGNSISSKCTRIHYGNQRFVVLAPIS